MFYFMKNDHEVIIKCRWKRGNVSFSVGRWWNLDGGSGGKALEKNIAF